MSFETSEFLARLRTDLPSDAWRDISDKYLTEPRGMWQGNAIAIVAPSSTQDVATVLRHAHAAGVPVVPYGGGTGLVGGQTAPNSNAPVVVSLERMRKIRNTYPSENILVAEAGVILADVQSAAQQMGRLFPLSLASEGSAQIGGLLATNAGGVNVLRYGMARDQVLGIEAVMADGQIFHGLKRLRKDNTGYDIKNLLIGSEGSLGIITAASLKLSPVPQNVSTALLTVESPRIALDVLGQAQDIWGDQISAFELISGQGPRFLAKTDPDFRQPWEGDVPDWSILIELGLSQGQDALAGFEALLASGNIQDGMIAQSQTQAVQFWQLRERIPLANRAIGAISSHDIALPLSNIPEFLDRAGAALKKIGPLRINCFGHVGDGNLHYNVFPPAGGSKSDWAPAYDDIVRTVYDLVADLSGSFSAEHGIGRLKADDLARYGDPVGLALMHHIKNALDPKGILNPGAVLKQ